MVLQASTTNHVYPVFGFLGLLSMVVLMPTMHLRAQNLGVLIYIMWTSLLCVVFSVNSVVWNNNVVNWAPVWCDISTRAITAGACGNATGLLCILRRLYRIIIMKAVHQSSHEIRRDYIIDLCIGIGFPVLLLPLQYVVEARRFLILENLGCFPAVLITPLAIPLYMIWPTVLGLVNALYAGLTICATVKRKAYKRTVMQGNRDIQSDHNWRLLAISGIGILSTLPYGIMSLTLAFFSGPIAPYTWDSTHLDYSQIIQLPVSEWANTTLNQFNLEANRWFAAFSALILFAFFGFTKDAQKSYNRTWVWINQHLGFHAPNSESSGVRKSSAAVHHGRRKHASCPPVISGTPVNSLRFVTNTHTSQIIASIAQSSRIRRGSLPNISLNLSVQGQQDSHAGDTSGGSFTVPANGGTIGSMGWQEQALSVQNDTAFPSTITEPAPVLEASVVVRRYSLDSPFAIPDQTSTTSIV